MLGSKGDNGLGRLSKDAEAKRTYGCHPEHPDVLVVPPLRRKYHCEEELICRSADQLMNRLCLGGSHVCELLESDADEILAGI
jgi:hypothetical protein